MTAQARLNILKHFAGITVADYFPCRTADAIPSDIVNQGVFSALVIDGFIEGRGADWNTALFFTTAKGLEEIKRLEGDDQ